MQEKKEAVMCGRGWRGVRPKDRHADHWIAAAHFPHGECASSGRGEVIIVNGLGRPPKDDSEFDRRTFHASCPLDANYEGPLADRYAWGAMSGFPWETGERMPGTALGARAVWCGSMSLYQSFGGGGLALSWVMDGWAHAGGTLLLPSSLGSDHKSYSGAILDAWECGANVVGDEGWLGHVPAGVVLDVPEMYAIRNGEPHCIYRVESNVPFSRWAVVIDGGDRVMRRREGLARLAGLVASARAALPNDMRGSPMLRDRAVELMEMPNPEKPASHGYHWPKWAAPRPWVRGYQVGEGAAVHKDRTDPDGIVRHDRKPDYTAPKGATSPGLPGTR